MSTPITLSIAGSDSGGGAGIQADIKAISATGGYACTVITATTAQNTLGVTDVHAIPLAHIEAQLDAVFTDLDVQAVKIGMLADSEIIRVVAQKLRQYQPKKVVLDPVMVATSGAMLLHDSAVKTLIDELLPHVSVITPNLPEAAALLGQATPTSHEQALALIPALQQLPTPAVLLKGGHLSDTPSCIDWLITRAQTISYAGPRIATQNTHGTGCTLSSALASFLAQGYDLEAAVQQAKHYISQAIAHADELAVGRGHGPVHHFYQQTSTDS
ncbi:bifunctional hydroxymethylpyrimidine kinase/phosphomethylpyrimidine kinase [Marinomonas ostreistagni]|uniref:bifunctional hydroxymethylpyrimidine kinase/phosphomethylpyrimidine kinase n=1 Tax=Marinomonas ostreistagni TaxID=359209 RepID=UPI00194ECA23|nr:bifunctional hydroxymethylpyrimidine kinase/phosphomethylpyrimidine kinase [Marinomonas ostreistagni]MBM6551873.1 bifunctional hydroxymethylpyrimidine kinase/phosphomethylpyrimidine kinase [Marinomonas ostreistagni]